MRFILFVASSMYFLSLHINCRSGAKHPASSEEDKHITIEDTIQFYTAESIKAPASQLQFPDGIRHIVVESSNDNYKFLHDPAIIYHKGALIAAWYNCPSEEIAGESCIRARRSYDGGKTWPSVEIIGDDKEKKEFIMYLCKCFLLTAHYMHS